MDFVRTPTPSGIVLIEDSENRIATEKHGEFAEKLKTFLPELAEVAGTVRIAIGLDRFMKAHAAEWLIDGQGAGNALREIAEYLEWSSAEIGEALHVERDVAIVRAASRRIDEPDATN